MTYLTIIIVILLGFIGFREWLMYKERDELMKKIMAKSYNEYISLRKTTPKEIKQHNEEQRKKEIKDNLYKDPESLTEEEQKQAIQAMSKR